MKKVLRVFMLLFALLAIWGGKVNAQTTTAFGSGSSCTVEGTNVTFLVNKASDLALWSNQSIGNNKNIIIKTTSGVVLNDNDLASLTTKLTYGNSECYFDLSQASVPEGTKLSEKFNGLQTSYILPLNSKEVASDFTGSKYYVMYTDGSKTEVVVKNGGISKAASVSYMQSSKEIVLDGETKEKSIDFSEFANLKVLDICALTLQASDATVKVPESITTIKVPQGFDKSKISPDAVLDKVQEVIPKEDPYTKNGNALTVNLEEGVSLLEILNQANMSYVSNLTIKTVGERKLTADDIATINDLKFRYTKEIDNNTLWQDATLNLEGCAIENYDILKSLKNNASTEGEEAYTGIRNVILPSGLDKTIVNAEHFAGLENMNAAISVSADQSAIVGYVATPGGLSSTMYQYLTFHPNAYNYSTKTLKSLTLSGSLLPSDFAGTIAGQEKILDEDGHLSYEVDAAGNVTYTGVKSFDTDIDSKTTQALLGASLTDIDLEDAVFTNYLDLNFSLLGHSQVVSVKLPTAKSMTEIPPLCMDKCTKVEKLVVPGNFEKLGAYAFNQMAGMHTLELGIGVKTLGTHCFQNCTGLKQVVLPIGMVSVGEYAFVGCTGIKDLNIPYGVKTIEAHAFENLDGLSAVRLPYTLETIGDYAFSDCNNISTITIPEKVKTIGEGAFVLSNSLRDIYLLGKTAPTIVDAYTDKEGVKHNGSFDEATLYNSGAALAPTKTTGTREDYWGYVSSTLPLGKGAAFLHFPKGCEEQYKSSTIKSFHAILVDEVGNPILDEDGKEIQIPNGQDVAGADSWLGKEENKGWKSFMLAVANQTGDDNSSVWTVRHIYDDTWYTMCFPFDITINQLISTFGSGFEIAYFCGVEKNATNNTMTLQFTESNYMKEETYDKVGAKAGVPYMIHPNSGVGNYDTNGHKKTVFVFSGVSPDITGNPVKGMKGYDYGEEAGSTGPSEDPNDPKFDHSYTFIGSYGTECKVGDYFVDKHNEYVDEGENNVLQYQVGNATGTYKKEMPKDLLVPRAIPEGYYFLGLAANATFPKFYRESRVISTDMDNSSPDKTYTTGLWTRFTAMVKGVDAEGQAAKKNLGIAIGDYDNKTVITGINIIGANGQKKEYIDLTNKVYNLNGQVVRSDSTDLKGLPAGVYVVKGKKFVVR